MTINSRTLGETLDGALASAVMQYRITAACGRLGKYLAIRGSVPMPRDALRGKQILCNRLRRERSGRLGNMVALIAGRLQSRSHADDSVLAFNLIGVNVGVKVCGDN